MYNRRIFLSLSGGALAAAVLPSNSFASGPGKSVFSPQSLGAYTQGKMTYDVFQSVQGSVFTAFLSDGQVAYLRLNKVVDFATASATASNTPIATPQSGLASRAAIAKKQAIQISGFSLQFSVRGPLTEQGTYLLDHGTLGRIALFVVPGENSASAIVIPAQPATNLAFSIRRF
jgi:hypothetical protein